MSRLGRDTPSAERDVIDRRACFLSLLAQAAVWLFALRVSQTFLYILRSICSGHGYPAGRAANTSRPRSDRFWLLELRVSQTFLDKLRSICSGNGYPGDAPMVGNWETVGRRGKAGQETLPEPAQQIR